MRILKPAFLIALGLLVGYPFAWIIAGSGVLGDVEFGYYKGFNIARHAIEKSGCAELIEYSGVNKDVFLEEFHFKVTTKSGRIVRLWFDASNMDVRQVCYQPIGLLVDDRSHDKVQVYTLEGLSAIIKEKSFRVRSLTDILCNVDELEQLFEASNGDSNAILDADPLLMGLLAHRVPD